MGLLPGHEDTMDFARGFTCEHAHRPPPPEPAHLESTHQSTQRSCWQDPLKLASKRAFLRSTQPPKPGLYPNIAGLTLALALVSSTPNS